MTCTSPASVQTNQSTAESLILYLNPYVKYKKHIVLTQVDKYPLDRDFSEKLPWRDKMAEAGCVCDILVCVKKVLVCKVKHKKKNFTGTTGLSGQKLKDLLKPIRVDGNGSPAFSAAMGWMESDSYSNAAVTLKATVWKGEPVSRLTECTEPFFRGALSWLRGTEGRAVMLWLSLTTHTFFPSNTALNRRKHLKEMLCWTAELVQENIKTQYFPRRVMYFWKCTSYFDAIINDENARTLSAFS